jgi:hypothetical protein
MKLVTPILAAFVLALTQQAHAITYTVVDGTNVGATPDNVDTYNVLDVGWLYTPPTAPYLPASPGETYDITDLGTAFGTSSSSPVTVDIYEESSLPSVVGTLIATGTLTAVADTVEFAALNGGAGVTLTSGDTYFVEFLNVSGLGENVAEDLGATSLGNWYYSNGGTIQGGPNTGFHSAPILEFATAAVPEPSTWALMVASVIGLIFFRRFRTASQRI